MTVAEAAEALRVALSEVEGVRAYTDLGAVLDPPAVLVGAPRLTWSTYDIACSVATFPIVVAVAADDRAPERLWELVPLVAAAIEQNTDAVVSGDATPGAWTTGGTDLPSYEITVEVPL